MSITHAQFTIERQYECSPSLAFRGFADPELKRRWFANPLSFTEQGAFFDGLDDPAEREHGTGWLLDRLGRVLAGEPVG